MNVETPMCVLTKLMVLLLLFFYYSVLNISLMTFLVWEVLMLMEQGRQKKGHSFTRLLKQNNWMSFFYKRPIVVVRTRECGEGNGKER